MTRKVDGVPCAACGAARSGRARGESLVTRCDCGEVSVYSGSAHGDDDTACTYRADLVDAAAAQLRPISRNTGNVGTRSNQLRGLLAALEDAIDG